MHILREDSRWWLKWLAPAIHMETWIEIQASSSRVLDFPASGAVGIEQVGVLSLVPSKITEEKISIKMKETYWCHYPRERVLTVEEIFAVGY